jgi:hypothetical protein
MRHGVRRQERRAAGVNVLAQRGFDLARPADAERHAARRAAPEITTPVETTIGSAPVGEPAHDNTRRAVAEGNATEGEALARHERAGEAVEIGGTRRVGHISKLSGNYQQIIIEIASPTSYTARNTTIKGGPQ